MAYLQSITMLVICAGSATHHALPPRRAWSIEELPARSDYDLRCEKTAPAAPSMHAIRRPNTM